MARKKTQSNGGSKKKPTESRVVAGNGPEASALAVVPATVPPPATKAGLEAAELLRHDLCEAEARRAVVESLNERLRTEVQKLRIEIAELRAQVDLVASSDSVSGVLNRRAFLESFRKEWSRARRYGRPLAVIMSDIDQFKVVNDGYGSEVGDRILRMVAVSLQKAARATDVIGRYGGDSFGVVLPEADPVAARRVAERLRKGIENGLYEHKGKKLSVTASFGVACSEEGDPEPEALLLRADDHLYQAKRGGRNLVVDDEG